MTWTAHLNDENGTELRRDFGRFRVSINHWPSTNKITLTALGFGILGEDMPFQSPEDAKGYAEERVFELLNEALRALEEG